MHEFFLSEVPDLTDKIVLECAVGHGVWGNLIRSEKNANNAYLVGFDLHKNYVKSAKWHRIYDDIILADARHMPFRNKSFDIIIASEILEHLEQKDGKNFLNNIDELCREVAIISTPNEYIPPGHLANESPLELHRSVWGVSDLKDRND